MHAQMGRPDLISLTVVITAQFIIGYLKFDRPTKVNHFFIIPLLTQFSYLFIYK